MQFILPLAERLKDSTKSTPLFTAWFDFLCARDTQSKTLSAVWMSVEIVEEILP